MVLVYSAIDGHPAQGPCEHFIRKHTGLFTSTIAVLEAKAILHKVYFIDQKTATQKLGQLAGAPIAVLGVSRSILWQAMGLADSLGIDLNDAVLLELIRRKGAPRIVTEDQHLAQICPALGITSESPLDAVLRQQIATWEAANLPPKGLARVLRRVHTWLHQADPQVAQAFWSHTAAGSHLP